MLRSGGLEPPAYEEIERVSVHQFFFDRKDRVCIYIQPKSDVSIRRGKNCTCVFINVTSIPDGARWETHNDYWIKSREDDGKGAVYIFSFYDSFESRVTVTEQMIGIEIER